MAFGLNDLSKAFSDFEDEASAWVTRLRPEIQAAVEDLRMSFDCSDRAEPLRSDGPATVPVTTVPVGGGQVAAPDATVFNSGVIGLALDRAGLGGLNGAAEIRNLADLEAFAARLPPNLAGPDATGEVATGSAAFAREDLAVAATLSAAARIVVALGPDAELLTTRGQSFTIAERYEDTASGFSAVRLTPTAGGAEVFSVDGLQVGSRADEVAALTLGRLQVESAAFQEMVADAAQLGLQDGREVFFTGPSLGGAVSQVAAYEAAQALIAADPQTPVGAVRLVTVDPLGGADAALATNGGTLDPAALQVIEALNIRTDGDIISRIGSHIGATLTLPGRDEAGNVVELNAAEAHVNVLSLLQNLSRDDFFATGVAGPPAEISGFALASNATADEVAALWLASGAEDDDTPRELQITGTASFDPTGTVWSLDADDNGTVDIAVQLAAPIDLARADLVLG
jgi:hypothetical protein